MSAKTIQRVQCDCKHEQQDQMYGKGVRVANTCAKAQQYGVKAVRCTVCSKLHPAKEGSLR